MPAATGRAKQRRRHCHRASAARDHHGIVLFARLLTFQGGKHAARVVSGATRRRPHAQSCTASHGCRTEETDPAPVVGMGAAAALRAAELRTLIGAATPAAQACDACRHLSSLQ